MSDVLILDDDVRLCEIMADSLRDEGLDVLTAGDTETALDLLQEHGARVLVADKRLEVGTAREDGHVLAEAVAHLYPSLSIVYITGGGFDQSQPDRANVHCRSRSLWKSLLLLSRTCSRDDVMNTDAGAFQYASHLGASPARGGRWRHHSTT